MKKYYLETFGCAMNIADSERISMMMYQCGFSRVQNYLDSNLVILNTCSVRQKGEDKVFGLVEKIYRENKNNGKKIKIGITGCMVRKTGIDGKHLVNKERDRNKSKKITLLKNSTDILNSDDKLFPRTIGKIDFVFRIEEIKYLPFILSHIFSEKIGDEYKYDDYLKIKQLRENPSSATIVIQTGCDNYCTYCIVPYTRGIEKSRSIDDILKEAIEAVKNGAKEITLTGQNVNSYGKEFMPKGYWNEEKGKWNSGIGKSPFRQLLEKLDEIEGLDRIRFTSSNPHDMTQDILDAHFDLKKTCNYLHFALQSGNNEILKKMNRKHTFDDFHKMVKYLRGKDPLFAISTDIITGFSGETEEMFQDTLKAFDLCEFDFSYNARYSTRKGTIASKIYPDDISEEIKAQRWHKLNNKLLETISKRNKLMINRVEEILVSGQKDEYYYGRTRNFKEVFFEGDSISAGDIVKVKITKIDKYVLKGILV